MIQPDLFERYPRKNNGKLSCDGLLNYLEDNQSDIKSGKLNMKSMCAFSNCHRDTIKKKANEHGLAYKAEDNKRAFQVPISLCNVPFKKECIKALA